MNEHVHSLVNTHNAIVQPLIMSEFISKNIAIDVLRLDKIHTVISGNKWFKLKYYLKDAIEKNHTSILTFGGAWSNHIIAAAFAAKQLGLQSIGIIRGESPSQLSYTLFSAKKYGMQLRFLDRTIYAERETGFTGELLKEYGDAYIIPEGGAGEYGIKGSKEILSLTKLHKYTHILCCIGSGTMFVGLINSSLLNQQITGIAVLKGMKNQQLQLNLLVERPEKNDYYNVISDYHFGGYAKKSPVLIDFMNRLYDITGIPTDFVYTGKLFYACTDLVLKDYFPWGSQLLIIHSGGLQGNKSLPAGTLRF